jgi:alpha-glucoside transport system substrate-binding protein
VGIESGQATGWTYTDWVEEMVLRQHGADVYDQWVSHEIPFSDDRIMASMQAVIDLWTDDNVYAASGTIAATAFGDNGQPLVDGDCYMHRQASFFSGFIPEGTPFADGTENAVDVFYFPDINGDSPVLGAGTLAAAFNADPNVHALLGYMASAEYAEARQVAQQNLKGGSPALSGFLSAAQGIDTSVFEPLEQSILEALGSAQIVRFDASDLMPADVGAGTFWTEGTSLVNGDITVAEAAATIDASWPTDTGSDSEGHSRGRWPARPGDLGWPGPVGTDRPRHRRWQAGVLDHQPGDLRLMAHGRCHGTPLDRPGQPGGALQRQPPGVLRRLCREG